MPDRKTQQFASVVDFTQAVQIRIISAIDGRIPRYLLEPLTALDEEQRQQGQQHHPVIMLLDALDEASDDKGGFEGVANLIARE